MKKLMCWSLLSLSLTLGSPYAQAEDRQSEFTASIQEATIIALKDKSVKTFDGKQIVSIRFRGQVNYKHLPKYRKTDTTVIEHETTLGVVGDGYRYYILKDGQDLFAVSNAAVDFGREEYDIHRFATIDENGTVVLLDGFEFGKMSSYLWTPNIAQKVLGNSPFQGFGAKIKGLP